MRSARAVAEGLFEGARARGLFAGLAAHAVLPLGTAFTASFGYLFGLLGHAYGWPFPRGGAASLADALAKELQTLGADVEVGRRVGSLEELQDSRIVLFDLTPRQILAICGDGLGGSYRRQLERFRYGPGAFKLDFALARPIPWRARECAQAATVHLGASLSEIAASEASLCRGARARPFVIVAQPSLFDETRAPAGRQTAWAYCHVPPGSEEDATGAIEDQIERFAPGFRDTVLARSVLTPSGLATYNENYVGGDIGGGSLAFPQLFLRPSSRLSPYTTPNPRLFIGSASTPPGGGVHGMCGHLAAKAALATTLR
jgi:phytoene dehydrogenase-like protein